MVDNAKDWLFLYKQYYLIEDFEDHLISLKSQGVQFFEFEGVKISTNEAYFFKGEVEYSYALGKLLYFKRFDVLEHPFERYKEYKMFLTLEYTADDEKFLRATFEYMKTLSYEALISIN